MNKSLNLEMEINAEKYQKYPWAVEWSKMTPLINVALLLHPNPIDEFVEGESSQSLTQ